MTLASLTDTLPFGVHWPLCAWLIDFLTLSACGSLVCKRYTVLVTHLFLSIHFPVRVLAEARDQDMWRYTDTNRVTYNPHPPTHRHLPSLYISTHAQQHTCTQKPRFTCFFPAPKDRSGTAVTGEVMRLWGGQTEQTLREPSIGSQVTPSSPSGVKGHGS